TVGVDRNRRDEEVMADLALQHLARIAHPERQAGRIVDAHVPLAPFQRLEITGVAVAVQLLDLPAPLRRRPFATIEQGHPVPARERIGDLERPGETGAAENEDAQRPGGTLDL